MKKYSKHFFLVTALVLLTLEFNHNALNTVNSILFSRFQKDSESLSAGRLLRSEVDGPFSYGGFLGWNHPYYSSLPADSTPPLDRFVGWGYNVPDHPDKFRYQYEALEHGYKVKYYERYYSQTGVQSFIYYAFGTVFHVKGNQLIFCCRLLNAIFLAVLLVCFLWWTYESFGFFPALLCLATILLSQWLILFANNMLYVSGLFYLAFIVNLLYLHTRHARNKLSLKKMGILTFISVFLKCYISGFDFIIPTLIMAVIPVIMYAYTEKWPLKKTAKFTALISLLAGMAVITVLIMLAAQLAVYYHSVGDALHYIVNTSERRTYGNQQDLLDVYQNSKNEGIKYILLKYLRGTAVDLPGLFSIQFITIFIIFALAAVAVFFSKNNSAAKGLLIGLAISVAGPLGWFIIFKYHAMTHTHMNFVIWHMPLMLLGSVLTGIAIKGIFKRAGA